MLDLQDEGHSEWASCVRFSPNSSNPIIVSCGWDKMVKVYFVQQTPHLYTFALWVFLLAIVAHKN